MYFCVNCTTGKEEEVRHLVTRFLENRIEEDFQVWFPLKENSERRNGKTEIRNHPLFPGYLFIWWNGDDETMFPFFDLRRLSGVVRILGYDAETHSLAGQDLSYAKWIHSNNGLIKQSRVILREGQRLRIIEGPLKGFDGNVVKVDRHRKRITVRFDFAGTVSDISFSVEFAEKGTRQVQFQEST